MAMAMVNRTPVTSNDVVSVKGRYLFAGDDADRRFFLKGIAFPVPPPPPSSYHAEAPPPDLSGWIAVLEQLAADTDVNVVRVYEMDCRHDFSPFLRRAAELGLYVIVPLTSRSGPGVLSRDRAAPGCYPRELYDYGRRCVGKYMGFPNVIAGTIGNEVMNDMDAWKSAPCVRAYLDDMAAYGRHLASKAKAEYAGRKSFLLMYATQHDSPSAEILPDEAAKLTLDYLSCATRDHAGEDDLRENTFIFGINIESWCSSLQTFEYEEDGVTESSYHSLWRIMATGAKVETSIDAVKGKVDVKRVPSISPLTAAVPIVFSEMGCSRELFNRDNSVQPKLVRDWKQVPVLLENGEMSDYWSGFVAYSYSGGGKNFGMMGGKDDPKWDGKHPLPPSSDYENFSRELSRSVEKGVVKNEDKPAWTTSPLPSCTETITTILQVWGMDLYPISDMPCYSSQMSSRLQLSLLGTQAMWSHVDIYCYTTLLPILIFAMMICLPTILLVGRHRKFLQSFRSEEEKDSVIIVENKPRYGSIDQYLKN